MDPIIIVFTPQIKPPKSNEGNISQTFKTILLYEIEIHLRGVVINDFHVTKRIKAFETKKNKQSSYSI